MPGINSFIHIEDVAAATALTVERCARGLYRIVDDEDTSRASDVTPSRRFLATVARAELCVPMESSASLRMSTASAAFSGSTTSVRRQFR
ncbi:MAG TPA: hypothetical protein VM848_07600 [Acidimicrobiia bacterium]|nr:hypothetical protein [Acidimicrobiia bacterium]